MASQKITFTLPEDLALQFLHRVPSRERSKYIADAIKERLAHRDRLLIGACEAANADADVAAVEKEFDALPDSTLEPWTDAESR